MEGSLNVIGYGLSAIGPGIGVGIMFAAWMTATARQPESAGVTRPMLFMGFALVEVMMLFGLVLAFILPV
ncbi:ATP synthase subunit C [Glycomyces arizonensis]|uniref:ATP synthase subunit C n=1 Tax=Glycomyces arizonensis TaxID=256035 RepID=UPI00040DDABE|nr:ATP synthase subunit C [Glycomyces arizonensis]